MKNLPNYQIQDTIHETPLTVVLRAIRLTDNKEVVIKTLKDETPHPMEVSRLKREYEIANKIQYPGIIEVYSLETYGQGNVAIIMELFAESMDRFLKKEKQISLDRFFAIAPKLATILGKFHNKSVIHKDINPRNILLDSNSNELRIIDFGISSELPRERQSLNVSERLEGSLPYISPEQTGRMNRELDYRTDYYSLGASFFEMLTGLVPFQAQDMMGWVYCHISKDPPRPSKLKPEIPQAIEFILLKLMAKNPEERYQSSFGLLKDLEVCHKEWSKFGKIENFQPGKWDISERFQIPQKLYGREEEVEALLSTFDKVANGNTELLLVSGYSGVGKSALVHEVHKPIVHKRGYFIEGKFDQFQRNIPYKAIAQAFRHLAHQLMAEPDDKLKVWKEKLLNSFGINGQIVLDMIPDFEIIVGKQPSVQELGPTESQNRFKIVFHNFVKVFADADHPLVIFLDDLQWSDTPTLNLLKHWMESEELPHLLIIATYRDNEVDVSHPLTLTLDEIRKFKDFHNLTLKPLSESSVVQIVADTLWTTPDNCMGLGKLLHKKTEGNPFFVGELFKNLYKEESICFNPSEGRWEWNMESIGRTEITSNVVEFMIKELHKLSTETQQVLKLAACIGNTFDLKTLSIIHEKSMEETNSDLFTALQAGLISPLSEDYKFVALSTIHYSLSTKSPEYRFQHDRVQQAAYSLIDESSKQEAHLKIGRLMLSHLNEEEQEEKLVDILRQLNEGINLITDKEEKEKLSRLNLKAGIKAKEATAYQPALEYLKVARELLFENPWEKQYDLLLAISMEYCQCAYLTGKIEEAEKLIDLMLNKVKTNLEKVEIYYIQQRHYLILSKMDEAIQVGIQSLSLLSIEIPYKPNPLSILKEVFFVKWNLRKKKISNLINLPELSDNKKRLAIRAMSEMAPAIYNTGNENLVVLLSFKMLNLSLRFGNSTYSSYAYFVYGNFLTNYTGNPKDGYEFGKLAVALNEKYGDKSLECRTLYTYNFFIRSWNEHWNKLTSGFQKAIESGYQSGDLFFIAYSSILLYAWNQKINLKDKLEHLSKSITICKSTNFEVAIDSSIITYQTNLNYCGLTDDRLSMNTDSFDERECIERIQQRKDVSGIAYYHYFKSDILFLYEEYRETLSHIIETERYEGTIKGSPTEARACMITFFTCTALYKEAMFLEKKKLKTRIKKRYKQMKKWADHCPVNFLHLRLAMDAEVARLAGKHLKAMKLYEEAAEKAREGGWQQDEGMILMLASKFYLNKNLMREAYHCLRDAYRVYERWGANGKLKFLKEKHSDLLQGKEYDENENTISRLEKETFTKKISLTNFMENTGQHLDMEAVSKASQTLSGEVVLEKLLQKLMDIVCESAGAEKGLLLLKSESSEEMLIQAERTEDGKTIILSSEPIKDNENLSIGIVQYVERSRKEIVLADATKEGDFIKDPYVQSKKPKSVLCIPVVNQGRLVGVLYLENNKVTSAFTPQRLKILGILSSQAAISLENAELYKSLSIREEEYRTLMNNLNVGVYRTSREGIILQCNPSLWNMLGFELVEEIWQKSINEFYINPIDREKFLELIIVKGECKNFETEFQKKDGTVFPVMLTARATFEENRSIRWIDGIVEDYTAQDKARKAMEKMTMEIIETNIAYEKFVPEQFLSLLDKEHITKVKLGDHIEKKMSVLFSDIRSFTTLSENMTPQENFDFVNSFLGKVAPLIRTYKGIIIKYLGDGMMSIFPESPNHAIDCGIAIQEELKKYNIEREKKNRVPIKVGFGFHYGDMMVGLVGEPNRMQGDILSDNVNLASRLESLTKHYGVPIIISESMYEAIGIKHKYSIRFLDKVKVKGKEKTVSIFEVIV